MIYHGHENEAYDDEVEAMVEKIPFRKNVSNEDDRVVVVEFPYHERNDGEEVAETPSGDYLDESDEYEEEEVVVEETPYRWYDDGEEIAGISYHGHHDGDEEEVVVGFPYHGHDDVVAREDHGVEDDANVQHAKHEMVVVVR